MMTHTKESLKTMLIQCGLWLFVALAISVYAALCPLFPASETQFAWFQRSGSVVVVLAVWVQFKLQSVQTYFARDAYCVPLELPKIYWTFYSVVSIINMFAMVLGTVIWGYGDILLKNI
ncbi:MAG: hypothetical protein WC762_06450 [Methylobacter sp.]